MVVHDLGGVEDVLDGVVGLAFFDDGGGGDALGFGEEGHGVGFDEVVVGGAAGHDDGGGDAGFVLADAFEDALALLGRGGAVGLGGAAEDDDGVEVSGGGVVVGDGEVVADDDGGIDEGREDCDGDDDLEELHEDRVAEVGLVSGVEGGSGAEDLVNAGEELREGEGLGEEVPALGAEVVELHGVEVGSGHDEDGEGGLEGFDLAGEVHAGAVGHGVVGDEEIDVGGAAEDLSGAVGVA